MMVPTDYFSPETDWDDGAWPIIRSGHLILDYGSVQYSYGILRSPCFEHDRDDAGYFIFSTGHVFGNWEITVTDSYGLSGHG